MIENEVTTDDMFPVHTGINRFFLVFFFMLVYVPCTHRDKPQAIDIIYNRSIMFPVHRDKPAKKSVYRKRRQCSLYTQG